MDNQPVSTPHLNLVLTADEVAALLKVSTKTVYRLVERQKLKRIESLRYLRITKTSLEKFVANG